MERPDEPPPASRAAARVVELPDAQGTGIDDLVALARAAAAGAGGLLAVVGGGADPEPALDWWLRATRLPRLGCAAGGHLLAFAVVAPPDARPPAFARVRWLAAAARRGSLEPAWRLLRRLAASERHHPSAPHLCVGALAVHPDARGRDVARPLIEAIRQRSAAHAGSAGVCCETGDAATAAHLEELGFRPAARFRADGIRRVALFRPDDEAPAFDGPVVVPIDDSIDLHRYRPAEIDGVVAGYVEAAWEAGLREVRIIHGRGRGVQRHRVQRLLARDPRVERYCDAPADRGGRGATVAWLSARHGERH